MKNTRASGKNKKVQYYGRKQTKPHSLCQLWSQMPECMCQCAASFCWLRSFLSILWWNTLFDPLSRSSCGQEDFQKQTKCLDGTSTHTHTELLRHHGDPYYEQDSFDCFVDFEQLYTNIARQTHSGSFIQLLS
jgi:hypothetical protein